MTISESTDWDVHELDVHDYVQGLKSVHGYNQGNVHDCDHFHAFWTIVEHYSMEDLEGVRILNCVSEVMHVVQLRKISFCEHVFRG